MLQLDFMNEIVSPQSAQELLELARTTLKSAWQKQIQKPLIVRSAELRQKKGGVFVTLKLKGKLRGCIGCLNSPHNLAQTTIEKTWAAAFADPRFPPLRAEELINQPLEIEISLLSSLTPLPSLEQWHLGEEGIYLRQGNKSAVFLPQVAQETGWSKEEFLSQLALKAGLPPQAWRERTTELQTFRVQSISGLL